MRRSGVGSMGTRLGVVLSAWLAGLHALMAFAGPPFVVASDFFIGGTGHDRVTDLVVDPAGNVLVAGVVRSFNFPGIDSAAVTNGGMDLRFVARIPPLSRSASLVAVVGAPTAALADAHLSKFGADEAAGLAVDASGNAYLVAYDGSRDYPIVGGRYQGTTGRKYVFKVSASGAVGKLSNALDPAINRVGGVAVDKAGAIYLTGSARDGLQTTPGAPYPTGSVAVNCIAPYVMKLDATAQTVLYATYLGNSGTQGSICGGSVHQTNILATNLHPTGHAIAVDDSGNAYVTGQAEPGLPATPGAPDFGTKAIGPTGFNNLVTDPASHAFVSKVNPAGTAIVYTARLGGSLRDRGTSIVVDPSGAAIVAGKTSSPDFPSSIGPAAVTMECLLWTPEFGFLAKLSPAGTLVFSTYLPLDGNQLDDCNGSGNFAPAKAAADSAGNIYVAGGTTPSNRDFDATSDAIIPNPVGYQPPIGGQLLQVFSGNGQQLYSTALGRNGVQGIGVDRWQGVIVADDYGGFQRLSPGLIPVDIGTGGSSRCADQTTPLISHVAASNDLGTVEFQVDGTSLGSAPIVNGAATKTASLVSGIRKVKATYRGAGTFDGYTSPEISVAINQAGACQ